MSAASSAEALLTEHLRYTPLSLIDDIINTINAIVYRALTAIETGLLSTPPTSLGFDQPSVPVDANTPVSTSDDPEERQRVEVEEGVHRLETLLEATVDRTFDKFEIYTLRNILWVPDGLEDWVRLKHYENLQLPLPATSATPNSILALRQRLQTTQQLNLTLSHTHTSNAALIAQLRSLLSSPTGQLSHLNPSQPQSQSLSRSQSQSQSQSHPPSSFSSSPAGALAASAQFTKAQLPALRSLLDELRPRLGTVATLAETGARPGKQGGRRDERLRYVEGVVERVVGTQLGATREGDAELGLRRSEEEVRAMERIAAAAGPGVESRPGADADADGDGAADGDEMQE